MIHFDAKHQKSEAKTKVKKRKASEKIEVKRKLSEIKRKKASLRFVSLGSKNYSLPALRRMVTSGLILFGGFYC
jgi:hypothetical protein